MGSLVEINSKSGVSFSSMGIYSIFKCAIELIKKIAEAMYRM